MRTGGTHRSATKAPTRLRHRRAQFFQCAELISDQSGFVNRKIVLPQNAMIAEMRFQRAERGNQYAGSGFLADPPPAPALPLGPFLQRLLPAEHMPQARPARRGGAPARPDRTPYRAPG